MTHDGFHKELYVEGKSSWADRRAKGQTPGDEAWPFAFGRKVATDKGSRSAAAGRMKVRGLMGD